MAKKLWIFPLTLLLLMGSVAFANDGNVIQIQIEKATKPALVQKQGVLPQEMKKIRVHGRGTLVSTPVSEGGNTTSIQAEKTEQPVFDPEGDVIPVHIEKAKKPALIKKHGYLYPGRSEIEPLGSRDELPHGYIFNYDDEDSEYYLSGGIAGDEWGIWFQSPQAACSLYAVEWQFYGGVSGGTINFNVMKAGTVWPDTVANADSIAVEDVFGDNLMGPGLEFPLEMAATGDWERFEFPTWGFFIDVGRDIFWIHWTKTGDYPMLLGDSDNPGDYLHTWDYEPNQDGDWKWSHYGYSVGIEAMVRCEVVFYEDPPPTVMANQMNDTYRTDAITLTADAWDNALDPALEGIASGNLIYSVNGVFDTLTATVTGDTAIGFTLTATIPAGATGDIVEYYFKAWDLANLHGESFPPLSFERTEPLNPDADLLVIRDNVSSSQLPLFEQVLDDNNFVYELWDAALRHGIDASIISAGWSNIFIYGWGNSTLPVVSSEEDPGYGAFLDNGGNLLLVDQDWFFGHNLDPVITFEAGDFAYDYFGMVHGTNDPCEGEPCVSTADTVFYGQNVTPMDEPFTVALGGITLNHSMYGTANWGDYFDASNATVIFVGASDGNTYGSVKDDGTYKAVCLGFIADAAGDTLADGTWDYSQFAMLLEGALEYFSINSLPLVTDVDGPEGPYFDSDPKSVTATVVDYNGDVFTVDLSYSVDGGDWIDVSMTDNGDSTFSADIPGQAAGASVDYVILATDAGGTYESEEYNFFIYEATTDVLFLLNNEMDPAAYPGMYYLYDAAGQTLFYWPDFWALSEYGRATAELLDFYDVMIEITTTADYPINGSTLSDHYDMVLAWLNQGNKSYVLAGDETFGAVNLTWADEGFAPGSFFYEMGIDSSRNDINPTSVTELLPLQGDVISGALYDALGADTLLYDPVFEIGYTNWLDGMVPTDDAVACFTDTSGTVVGVHKEWSNGSKTVYLGFDPLSLNGTPYTWWGASDEGALKQALNWFGITAGVDEDGDLLPESYALYQNYPNPFNPVTNLKFDLPKRADVKLVIYNMLGQEVSTLINRDLRAGYHNVLWNGTDKFGRPVGSGVYIYRIKAGDFTSSKKMLLLK